MESIACEGRCLEDPADKEAIGDAADSYSIFFKNAPLGMFISKLDGSFLDVNNALAELFGYSSPQSMIEQVKNIPKELYVKQEQRDEIIAAAEKTDDVVYFEAKYRRLDGSIFTGGVHAKMIQRSGKPSVLEGLIENISEKNKSHLELCDAKERAESASKSKSLFLANMSHEIRTPLSGIIGMCDMVVAGELTAMQKEYIFSIKNAAKQLLVIINDILDIAKIETGRLEFESLPFDLRKTVDTVVDVFSLKAREKQLRLNSYVEPDVPNRLVGDPGRLRQVLSNLLSNAMKFTDQGLVQLKVERLGDAGSEAFEAGDNTTLLFTVSDTGRGIPGDKIESVFNRFEQIDDSFSKDQPGSGLGLSISRHLVHLMAGEITARSTPGKGSIFSFTARFPLEKRKAGRRTAEGHSSGGASPLRILLVEDDHLNRKSISFFLRRSGHRVESVENGVLALSELAKGGFDLVLMDVQMPNMDGLSTVKAIRDASHGLPDPEIPVIALTANLRPNEEHSYKEAGMNDVVTKPVELEELFTAIHRVMSESEDVPEEAVEAVMPTVNIEELREKFSDSEDILKEMVSIFLRDTPGRMEGLREALKVGDVKESVELAHKLINACGVMTALRASSLAYRIEEALHEDQLEQARRLYESLRGELSQVLEVVRKAFPE
jgi:PAS domain S-box-containing protein